jgi:hypothetical protein
VGGIQQSLEALEASSRMDQSATETDDYIQHTRLSTVEAREDETGVDDDTEVGVSGRDTRRLKKERVMKLRLRRGGE